MNDGTCRRAMRKLGMGAILIVSLTAATAVTTGCTPLQVVTHTVSTTEASVPQGRYTLDPNHWSIVFDVDHFHYSRVMIRFDKADGHVDWLGDLTRSTVDMTIDAASVNTRVPALDRMVKGASMFDVAQYPDIRFVGKHFTREGDNRGTLVGDLTIHGTTRSVSLDVTFNGFAPDPLTKLDTIGFSGSGHFSRAQFGLSTWFPAVGNDVHFVIQAEFVRGPAKSV